MRLLMMLPHFFTVKESKDTLTKKELDKYIFDLKEIFREVVY